MARKRYAQADFVHVAHDSAWWTCIRLHRYGKTIWEGEHYLGDGFNHQHNTRALEHAAAAALDTALSLGYDGIKVARQVLRL